MRHRSLSPISVAAFAVVTAVAVPRTGVAQTIAPPADPAVSPQATPAPAGPRTWLIDGGAAVFAASYVPALVIGASSTLNTDRMLLMPLAGPWIDLGQRPACTPGIVCESQSAARGLLILDGVFQTVGIASFIGGLVTSVSAPSPRVASGTATMQIAPAPVSAGGYGVVAFGTF